MTLCSIAISRSSLCQKHFTAARASLGKKGLLALSLGWVVAALSPLALPDAQAANDAFDTNPVTTGGVTGFTVNFTLGTATPAASGTGTPATGDALFFGTSTATTLTNDLSGFSFAGLTFNAGASAFTVGGNAITVTAATVNNSSVTQTLGFNIAEASALALTTNRTGGNFAVTGIISGTVPLIRGGGTVTLTNANTATGTLEVLDNSTLALNFAANTTASNILSTGTTLALGSSVTPSSSGVGTLTVTGSSTQANTQTLTGTTLRNFSRLNFTAGTGQALTVNLGTITSANAAGGAANFNIGSGVTLTNGTIPAAPSASGLLLGGGNYVLGTVNATTWAATTATSTTSGGTISGLATYGTDPTVSSDLDVTTDAQTLTADPRTVRFNTAGVATFNVSGTRTVSNGGILMTANTNQNLSISDQNTAANVIRGVSNRGLYVFQYNTANTLSIDTVITQNGTSGGGLTKMGAGTVILSRANTYFGSTNVEEGTLIVTGSITAGGGTNNITNVAIATGPNTRLAGTGLLTAALLNTGGNVVIGGTLAPGTTAGTIGNLTINLSGVTTTTNAAMIMNSGASFEFNLGVANPVIGSIAAGSSDLLTIAGTASLTGTTATTADVSLNGNTVLVTGATTPGFYKLIDVDAATTVSGYAGLVLSGAPAGSALIVGNGTVGDLNDLYLQVVPEPGTWAMIAGGMGVLALVPRRRRA